MTRTKVLYTFKGGSTGNDPNIPNLKTCQLLVDVEKQRDTMIVSSLQAGSSLCLFETGAYQSL